MIERDSEIERLFEPGAELALMAYLHLLHPADIADLLHHIRPEFWPAVADRISAEVLAEVVANLDRAQREVLGLRLPTERLAEAIAALESDDAADVVADLPETKAEAILAGLKSKRTIETLLAYPEDSAGGIMQTELCRVLENKQIADAIEAVRQTRSLVEDVLEVYVVDHNGRLKGTVALEDLVLSPSDKPLRSIAQPVEHRVTPEVDQEVVAQLFRRYDQPTLPVVDLDGLLVGRITFDDIHDVIEEEASEDLMTITGASSEDLLYGGAPWKIALFRLPWLFSSLFGSLITGFVLSQFSKISQDAILMASFVPVVTAMSGNLGAQSAMIIMRGLALRTIEVANLRRTVVRELAVATMIGAVCGSVVGSLAHLRGGDPALGFAVGLSLLVSMTLASAVGVAAPALFKSVGVDPALGAGPLVTTGCDILGVTTYLLVSMAILH